MGNLFEMSLGTTLRKLKGAVDGRSPYLGGDVVLLLGELDELLLERDGGVVSTEHLGGESGHEAVQILVERRRVQPVEEVVAPLQ